jgi:hypothetical protein
MFSPKPARFTRVKSVNVVWLLIAIELDNFVRLSSRCALAPSPSVFLSRKAHEKRCTPQIVNDLTAKIWGRSAPAGIVLEVRSSPAGPSR